MSMINFKHSLFHGRTLYRPIHVRRAVHGDERHKLLGPISVKQLLRQ